MEKEPFVIERTYSANIQRVWQAITDLDKMREWYFNLSDFKPELGFEFQFEGGSDGKTYIHLCKVTEVVIGKKLSYSWCYEGYEGYSVVSFELFEEGDSTRVKLTHIGLETFPQNNTDFARESFNGGWTYFIGKALKEYVEK